MTEPTQPAEISDEELDRAETIAKAATPGPWTWLGGMMAEGSERTYAGYPQRITGRNPDSTDTSPVLVAECYEGHEDEPPPNTLHITTWHPAFALSVLATLRAQAAELEALRRVAEAARQVCNAMAPEGRGSQSWRDSGMAGLDDALAALGESGEAKWPQVVRDPTVPPGEIQLRDDADHVLGRITGMVANQPEGQ
jgi:hypothetical protein